MCVCVCVRACVRVCARVYVEVCVCVCVYLCDGDDNNCVVVVRRGVYTTTGDTGGAPGRPPYQLFIC